MTADLRLLQALAQTEAALEVGRARPSWIVTRAARAHGVSPLALALAIVDKLIGCQRARATAAGIAESDLEPDRAPPKAGRVGSKSTEQRTKTVPLSNFSQERNDDDAEN